jgi:hypothetical protein
VLDFQQADWCAWLEQARVIEMSAVWIAGFVIFMLMGMFLTLALCRCAALADRGIEGYLADDDPPSMPAADLHENREGHRAAHDDDPDLKLSRLSPSS